MTLFDLDNGELFRWNDDIYKLIAIDNSDRATVRRMGIFTHSKLTLYNGQEENFNPYAEVTHGELICHWREIDLAWEDVI